jgi:hypothetical protein
MNSGSEYKHSKLSAFLGSFECRSNNIEHEKAWRVLYAELYIRDGFSVNARIKNSKATSKLELVAEHGKLGIL